MNRSDGLAEGGQRGSTVYLFVVQFTVNNL